MLKAQAIDKGFVILQSRQEGTEGNRHLIDCDHGTHFTKRISKECLRFVLSLKHYSDVDM
jgi:hypothetical protein